MKKWKFLHLFAAMLLIACSAKESRKLTVASKNHTESIIQGYIIAELIKAKTDLEVDLKPNMGGTFVVFEAFKSGEVDVYPDYTGTIYQANLKLTDKVSPAESLRIVQQKMKELHNAVVMQPFGFNNTYAMGMLRNRAEELGIRKTSDLRNHTDLVAGFDSEFMSREVDGATPMFAAYGFEPDQPVVQVDVGLRYQALVEGKADYTDVYTTDAKLKRFGIAILEDDLSFFPSYYAVPVIRQDTLDRFPELREILASLGGTTNEEEATALNYDIEENKIEPKEVAIQFLKSKGLIE